MTYFLNCIARGLADLFTLCVNSLKSNYIGSDIVLTVIEDEIRFNKLRRDLCAPLVLLVRRKVTTAFVARCILCMLCPANSRSGNDIGMLIDAFDRLLFPHSYSV